MWLLLALALLLPLPRVLAPHQQSSASYGNPLLLPLSKRAQALGGTSFGFEVTAGGGAVLTLSGSKPTATFSLISSFPSPGRFTRSGAT